MKTIVASIALFVAFCTLGAVMFVELLSDNPASSSDRYEPINMSQVDVVDTSAVQERNPYQPYGVPTFDDAQIVFDGIDLHVYAGLCDVKTAPALSREGWAIINEFQVAHDYDDKKAEKHLFCHTEARPL